MAVSLCKIKQRALIVVDYGASVNGPFLDAGIVSMFLLKFPVNYRRLFCFEGYQILIIKDKHMTLAKLKFLMASPGMLKPWSHAFLPTLPGPWAASWCSWIGGTVRTP
jgi:hypothetical protein